MRTRWLEPLIITLGLTSFGFTGCKGDDEGGTENADGDGDGDGDGDSSAESTMTGDGDTTTGDGDGDTSCTPGELGCECNGGLCLGDLECTNGICSDPECLPGELACECNDGQCLGELVCVEGVCLEDGGTDTDTDTTADTDATTDTGMECPNANEMMCDGVCVDVVENEEHCGGCGQTCTYSPQTDLGECHDAECGPYWSACYAQADSFTTCNEICANEGHACVEGGCDPWTWMQSNSPAFCMSLAPAGNGTVGACDGQIQWNDAQLRCCCTQ